MKLCVFKSDFGPKLLTQFKTIAPLNGVNSILSILLDYAFLFTFKFNGTFSIITND